MFGSDRSQINLSAAQAHEPKKDRERFDAAAACIIRHFLSYKLSAAFAICIIISLKPVSASAAAPAGGTPMDGARLYRRYCAQCHSKSRALRAPQLSVLSRMQPRDVLDSLESGTMRFEGLQRTTDERRAIAEFITGKKLAQEEEGKETLTGRCKGGAPFDPASRPQWNGWGADLANARFQSAQEAGLTTDEIGKLSVKWAFGFPPNTMMSKPTVVGGRVFVGTLRGSIYSLDAAKGCLYWSGKNSAGVRSAMTVALLPGSNPPRYALYFGDVSGSVHALDANTGEQLWTARANDHPMARITGAPALYANRLYVPASSAEEGSAADPRYPCCTFRGSITAFDALSGKRIWQAYTIQQQPHPTRKNPQGVQLWGPSGAGVWSAPTIDKQRGVLYATTGDNYSDPATRTSDAILALDLKTGKLLWSRQFTRKDAFTVACLVGASANCPEANGPDLDFGSSAILRKLPNGKRILVAGQKSGVVHAIDPDRKGAIVWEQRVGKGSALGGIQWGPAADDNNVYVALSDIGMKLRQSPGAVATVELNGRQGGGLFAYDLATGERRWARAPIGCGSRPNCSPAQSAAVSAVPGGVFSGSVDGHVRAYSAAEGKVLWDFDTAREFKTVNAISAKGGSLDGPGGGPTIAGGMLFLGSGYGLWGGMPGNVLLGFSADGK
jgi:polyvinyl alcohol dehydrogenase (cytochrome)